MIGKDKKYLGIFILCLVFLTVSVAPSTAQEARTEEIIVKIDIPRLLQQDIFAHYDGAEIYIPLVELFSLLEITVESDFQNKIFSGSYLGNTNKFKIDLNSFEAEGAGGRQVLDSSWFVLTDQDLFLRIDLFNKLFGIKMFFDFSDLSVYLPLKEDFPVFQKLKRQLAHKNLRLKRQAEVFAETIPRKRDYLNGGVLDWTATAAPIGGSGHYFNMGLGGMLLGGDLELSGTGNTSTGVQTDQLRYHWHYYFENNKYITQVEAGKVNTYGHLSRNLTGVVATNRPQIRRKHFQTITISDEIGPGWEVEMFINGRLADFAYTDNDGRYDFNVDINYGSTRIELKFFGPNGEIRTEEQWVTVPFNIIPKGEIEYSTALGQKTNSDEGNTYFQAGAYYGLRTNITLGLGTDFPLESTGETPLSSFEMTYQPSGNLLLNGVYSPSNSMKYSLSYSNPSLVNIYTSFTKYYENEFLNKLNRQNSLDITISAPLKFWGSYLSPRIRFSRSSYPTHIQQSLNYSFKIRAAGFNLSYIGYRKQSDYGSRTDHETVSKLLLSTSLIRFIRPQIGLNYDHTRGDFSKMAFYLNKRVFRNGQITLSYEKNPLSGYNIIMATFQLNTDFASFSSRFIRSGERNGLTQTQRGSIRFDPNTSSFRFSRYNGIGSGSAVIWPFHDANYNGQLDEDEELLKELRAKMQGGARMDRRSGNLVYYDNLRAYDEYTVEIDPYSLDNPMLQPSHEYYKVTVNPNTVTLINVPIVTAGEIAGKVDRVIPDGTIGVGGIRIKVRNEVTGKELDLTTFNNGEFFHLGLVPGLYRAYIDPDQLKRYGYISDPPYIKFQIRTIEGGDYFGETNFILKKSGN